MFSAGDDSSKPTEEEEMITMTYEEHLAKIAEEKKAKGEIAFNIRKVGFNPLPRPPIVMFIVIQNKSSIRGSLAITYICDNNLFAAPMYNYPRSRCRLVSERFYLGYLL